jgi:hypothetical protein
MASCLDESPSSMPLDFICCIDGNYTTFAETLAEQFGASSYGDLVFGRQVAIYLRQGVPDSVRLAIWHQLAEVQVLKLLPPLTQCCGQQWGYLYPFEVIHICFQIKCEDYVERLFLDSQFVNSEASYLTCPISDGVYSDIVRIFML